MRGVLAVVDEPHAGIGNRAITFASLREKSYRPLDKADKVVLIPPLYDCGDASTVLDIALGKSVAVVAIPAEHILAREKALEPGNMGSTSGKHFFVQRLAFELYRHLGVRVDPTSPRIGRSRVSAEPLQVVKSLYAGGSAPDRGLELTLDIGVDASGFDGVFGDCDAAQCSEHRPVRGTRMREIQRPRLARFVPCRTVCADALKVGNLVLAAVPVVASDLRAGTVTRLKKLAALLEQWPDVKLPPAPPSENADALVISRFPEQLSDLAKRRPRLLEEALDIKLGPYMYKKVGVAWIMNFESNPQAVKHENGHFYVRFLLEHPRKKVTAIQMEEAVPGSGRRVRQTAKLQELLDDDALKAVKREYVRLTHLRDEAKKTGDMSAVEKHAREIDELGAHLDKDANLRGKSRKIAEARMKARGAVGKAIGRAKDAIRDNHPALYAHLNKYLHTRYSFHYSPDKHIDWLT